MIMRTSPAALLLLATLGCSSFASPEPKAVDSEVDKWGCKPPAPSVFTQAGLDIKLAQSTLGKIVTGDLSITTDPKVTSLATAAQRDAEMRDYLRCLALRRDGLSPEQAMHLEEMTAFLSLSPTPDQFLKWRQEHPAPVGTKTSDHAPASGTVGLGGENRLRVPVQSSTNKVVTITLSNTSDGNRGTNGSDLDRFRVFDSAGIEVAHGKESRIEPGRASTVSVNALAGETYYAQVAARVQSGSTHVAKYELTWR